MNRAKLYDENGMCRLCQTEGHENDCPGKMIDGVMLEFRWHEMCAHQGHADDGAVTGDTMEELVNEARSCGPYGLCEASLSLRYVFTLPQEQADAIYQESNEAARRRQRQMDVERQSTEYGRELARLQAKRGDFLPEGYDRQVTELKAKYPALELGT